MKRKPRTVLLYSKIVLFLWCFCYLMGCLIAMTFNIMEWDKGLRVAIVLSMSFSVVVSIAAAIIFSLEVE